jgi:hypothetical protein
VNEAELGEFRSSGKDVKIRNNIFQYFDIHVDPHWANKESRKNFQMAFFLGNSGD